MTGNVLVGVRTLRRIAVGLGLLSCMTAQAALAADCPGHPDALGTSRTLVVDPREHPRIGTMQYAETLPLADGEVVLTFDDGPLPRYSNRILEILASQCVKATFFLVGRQAQANPEGVRKVRDAGHTVATHSQNHPTGMHRLPIERVQQEIDEGIASVAAALGDGTAPAPFFRVPGLARAEAIEEHAAAKGAQVWSADFPADDWRHVSSARVYELAMQRLEAKGKGILLLHDIQARTVAALPKILHELKARGYRIVHVVPATAELAATPTEPQQWRLHPPSEDVAISRWPSIPNFVFAESAMLPGPWLSDSYWNDEWLTPSDRARSTHRRRSAAATGALAPAHADAAAERRQCPAGTGAERFRIQGSTAPGRPDCACAPLAARRSGGLSRACHARRNATDGGSPRLPARRRRKTRRIGRASASHPPASRPA